METLVEIIVEFVLQLFGDTIIDALFRSTHPVMRTLGYCLFCALVGGLLAALSLVVYGSHVISNETARLGALCIFPLVNGVLMTALGKCFATKGRTRSSYEYFFPAFIFSAVFGLVRFLGAR
jgi:hypothetical protein